MTSNLVCIVLTPFLIQQDFPLTRVGDVSVYEQTISAALTPAESDEIMSIKCLETRAELSSVTITRDINSYIRPGQPGSALQSMFMSSGNAS